MPAISIVLPLYNSEHYIEQCIESICRQTVRDFELIIVDDGSNDNSGKICDNYAQGDNRIHVIHKGNDGVASARNVGIAYASAQYLIFIDSDDEFEYDDYLKDLLEDPDVDYVVDGFRHKKISASTISEYTSQITVCEGNDISLLPGDFFINGLFHSCCGKRYKTQMIHELGICFPNARVSEDSLFNLEYIKNITSWKIINKCGYCYIHRQIGENATDRFELKDIDTYIFLHEKMIEQGIKKKIVRNTLYAQYFSCIRKCYQSEENWKLRRKKMKAILSKRQVMKTLVFTRRNMGEWLSGVVLCSCNYHLINLYDKILRGNR